MKPIKADIGPPRGGLDPGDDGPLARPVFGLVAGVEEAAVFGHLTSKEAQGQCAKCHSVDRKPDGNVVVNWTPGPLDGETERITRYAHSPHFGVVGKTGCLTCHVIDDKAKYLASYAAPGPVPATSNFRPMPHNLCADCHTSKSAGENCLQCHTYHVEPIPMRFLRTGISGGKVGR